jgi:hypothetical protein
MKNTQLRIVVVSLVLALPAAASAQPPIKSAQRYCTVLSAEYERYVSGNNEYNYLAVPSYGEAACKAHKPYAAIPALERTLENAKLPLPSTPAAIAELPPGVTRTGGG